MRNSSIIKICCLMAAVASCGKSADVQTDVLIKEPDRILRPEGISRDVVALSVSDAEKLANLYLFDNVKTKSEVRQVREILPVYDEQGNVAMYAVNFDDGFIWVSGTKEFYPILAEVDHGSFSYRDTGYGIDVVRQELVQAISAGDTDIDSLFLRRIWKKYEYVAAPLRTKYNSEYEDEVIELYDIAADNGYEIFPLSEAEENGVPEYVINELTDVAMDAYAGRPFDETEYDWQRTAYVMHRTCNEDVVHGPLLTTVWDQVWPYNMKAPVGDDGDNLDLGCVTVATAQVMKYYNLPVIFKIPVFNDVTLDYKWSSMPDDYNGLTDDLAMVLAYMRIKLGIKKDGTGYLSDARDYLNSFITSGTKFKLKDYNRYSVVSDIKNGHPVILGGRKKSETVGHAWVADGCRHVDYGEEYKLYTLRAAAAPDFDYENTWTVKVEDNIPVPIFHMNWGWGGFDNGWFYGENWTPSKVGNGSYDFTYEKQMLYK